MLAMIQEAAGAAARMPSQEAAALIERIRSAHQCALLALVKGEPRGDAAAMLNKVALGLEQLCEGAPAAAQWQAFAQLAQALGSAEGKLDADSAGLLRQLDMAMRELAQDWPASLQTPAFPELAPRLLEAAGGWGGSHPQPQKPRSASRPLEPSPAGDEVRDAPLKEAFSAQVGEALWIIGERLPAWRRHPKAQGPLVDLRQAFKDLKLGARQAGAGELAELAWSIENLLDRVVEETVPAGAQLFALLERAAASIPMLRDAFRDGAKPDRARIASVTEDADLLASGGTIAAPTPGALGGAAPHRGDEAELLAAFFAEAGALVQAVARDIQDWSREPQNPAFAERLLRNLHTLKGGARLSGQPSLGKLAHGFESLLLELKEAGASLGPFAFQELRVQSDDLAAVLGHLRKVAGLEAPASDEVQPDRASPAPSSGLLADAEANAALRAGVGRHLGTTAAGLRDLAAALPEQPQPAIDGATAAGEAPSGVAAGFSKLEQLPRALLSEIRQAERLLGEQARMDAQLMDGLLRTRMVPFAQLLPRLRSAVRRVADELGKAAELRLGALDWNLDPELLECLAPTLEQLLINAVSHGVEPEDARREQGKPEAGRIDLRIARKDGEILIQVEDDGPGIDLERVRQMAAERGLLAEDADWAPERVAQLVLAPGISTAEPVTQASGRGIGLDLAQAAVQRLGGRIDVSSNLGRGALFAMHLPIGIATARASFLELSGNCYAILLDRIQSVVPMPPATAEALRDGADGTWEREGVAYQLRYLGEYLAPSSGGSGGPPADLENLPVALFRCGERTGLALYGDAQRGEGAVLLQRGAHAGGTLPGMSQGARLDTGQSIPVLNLPALAYACQPQE